MFKFIQSKVYGQGSINKILYIEYTIKGCERFSSVHFKWMKGIVTEKTY